MTDLSLRRVLAGACLTLSAMLPLGTLGAMEDPADFDQEDAQGTWPGGLAAFEALPFDVLEAVGVVGEMEPAGPFVIIEGLRFGFGLQPDIRLRAGAGAPTLLQPGMVLEFYYAAPDDDELAGRIIAAIELSPDAREPD